MQSDNDEDVVDFYIVGKFYNKQALIINPQVVGMRPSYNFVNVYT